MQKRLVRPLPKGRTYDSVWNHYVIEKGIADRIKQSSKEERKTIYSTMYDELFDKVPDHPRLTRRADKQRTEVANNIKYKILGNNLNRDCVFAEFAPGDCKFSYSVSDKCRYVYGIDISDQRDMTKSQPENFQLVIYDGYTLIEPAEGGVDILFSDQLIEHFHPEETEDHFVLAYKMLKDNGKYVLCTPHKYSGPQDVSMYFSYEAEGFHLKEWTYTELSKLLKKLNYRKIKSFWFAKGIKFYFPIYGFIVLEKILGRLPLRIRRKISRFFVPSICIEAIK